MKVEETTVAIIMTRTKPTSDGWTNLNLYHHNGVQVNVWIKAVDYKVANDLVLCMDKAQEDVAKVSKSNMVSVLNTIFVLPRNAT